MQFLEHFDFLVIDFLVVYGGPPYLQGIKETVNISMWVIVLFIIFFGNRNNMVHRKEIYDKMESSSEDFIKPNLKGEVDMDYMLDK